MLCAISLLLPHRTRDIFSCIVWLTMYVGMKLNFLFSFKKFKYAILTVGFSPQNMRFPGPFEVFFSLSASYFKHNFQCFPLTFLGFEFPIYGLPYLSITCSQFSLAYATCSLGDSLNDLRYSPWSCPSLIRSLRTILPPSREVIFQKTRKKISCYSPFVYLHNYLPSKCIVHIRGE